jgi:hypothetical protein
VGEHGLREEEGTSAVKVDEAVPMGKSLLLEREVDCYPGIWVRTSLRKGAANRTSE